MTGNTAGTMPAAATTALGSVSLTTDTLTIPAATVSLFRGSADAYVKVAVTHSNGGTASVISPVVVKVVACPAPAAAATNS